MFLFPCTRDRQWKLQKRTSIWYHWPYIVFHGMNKKTSQGKERKDMRVTCPDCGHDVPDGKRSCIYCGAPQDEEVVNTESKTDIMGEDVRWSFSSDKSRRPIHLSPVVQALIFLVSAALGGLLVFLMG